LLFWLAWCLLGVLVI